ncbi:MAG TPA: hypothetical protein VHD83_12755 [Puia sp.]|nr:hypothetical protein [Puia sp.]
MVTGLALFRDYFKRLEKSYILIGGAACDQQFEERGLTFRATKDLDIILVAEALGSEFIERFWQFIKAGGYENKEKSAGQRQYYRFSKPRTGGFPVMLELFSRKPDIITAAEGMTLTPIPADDDLSSLSAILMDEVYYNFTMGRTIMQNDLPIADIPSLICLKAKAHLDLAERKEKGEKIDHKNVAKHRSDVFRLIAILEAAAIASLEGSMRADMEQFIAKVEAEKPETKDVLKSVGLPVIELPELVDILRKVFLPA